MSFVVFFAVREGQTQQAAPLPADAIARFHLNNGGFLVDVGRFLEAVEEFQTAQSVAAGAAIKAESLSSEAQVRALFLDDPAGALGNYQQILADYQTTTFYEGALFQSGMLAYQMQRTEEARVGFDRYLREFPSGDQATTAEFMRRQTTELLAKRELPPAPVPPPISKEISVRLGEWSAISISSAADILLVGESRRSLGKRVDVRWQDGAFLLNRNRVAAQTVELSSDTTLAVGKKSYRGKLRLLRSGDNGLIVINQISIEDYIASVVTSEMPGSFPLEALKAQAVAARTYALYHVQHPRRQGVYDVYDDPRSQAYNGVGNETTAGKRAVAETAGQVLVYQGRPILAYYDSNNGGKTADSGFIFDLPYPYFLASDDPYSRNEPHGVWDRFFTFQEVRHALGEAGYSVGGIQNIQPTLLCPSGRIVKLAVIHSGGRLELRARTQFRVALNRNAGAKYKPENLPDILMVIQKDGNGFRIQGGGWGHGVGLSQYGSRARAREGQNYRRILAAYYPDTVLQKVY